MRTGTVAAGSSMPLQDCGTGDGGSSRTNPKRERGGITLDVRVLASLALLVVAQFRKLKRTGCRITAILSLFEPQRGRHRKAWGVRANCIYAVSPWQSCSTSLQAGFVSRFAANWLISTTTRISVCSCVLNAISCHAPGFTMPPRSGLKSSCCRGHSSRRADRPIGIKQGHIAGRAMRGTVARDRRCASDFKLPNTRIPMTLEHVIP